MLLRPLRNALLILLAVMCLYVAVFVPLGEKTLWEHTKAIAGSQEGKALVEGVQRKASELHKRAREKVKAPEDLLEGVDQLSSEERKKLRELIRERLANSTRRKKTAAEPARALASEKLP